MSDSKTGTWRVIESDGTTRAVELSLEFDVWSACVETVERDQPFTATGKARDPYAAIAVLAGRFRWSVREILAPGKESADADVLRLRAAIFDAWELVGEVANECEPCPLPEDLGGGSMVPTDEVLADWGKRCTAACVIFREALGEQ